MDERQLKNGDAGPAEDPVTEFEINTHRGRDGSSTTFVQGKVDQSRPAPDPSALLKAHQDAVATIANSTLRNKRNALRRLGHYR